MAAETHDATLAYGTAATPETPAAATADDRVRVAEDRKWGGLCFAVVVSALALVTFAGGETVRIGRAVTLPEITTTVFDDEAQGPNVEVFVNKEDDFDWESWAKEYQSDNFVVETDPSTGAYKSVIYRSHFWEFPRVKAWLHSRGVFEDSDVSLQLSYLPKKIVVEGKPELIMGGGKLGSFGSEVMRGYTTFALQMNNATSGNYAGPVVYSAAYTIVMDMRGHIVSISPTMYDLGDLKYHFIALKPWPLDPAYMMGGVDIEETQKGPVYLWRWKDIDEDEDKRFVKLGVGDQDCHDLTLSIDEAAMWFSYDDKGFQKVSLSDGDQLYSWTADERGYVYDPNHVQLIEEETYAIVSSRITNAFLKVDVKSGDIKWIAGGDNATMIIYDEKGRAFPPGTSLFWGQHNVEYMGDDKYYLFDDGSYLNHDADVLKSKNVSSMMIIQIKKEKDGKYDYSGHVIWKYNTEMWTSFYGDHDRLLTGNSMGAMWDSKRAAKHDKVEAQILEVVPETKELAWKMGVYGNQSLTKDNADNGWMIYSAERFYTSPIISNAKCVESDEGKVDYIKFDVHDNFRQNFLFKGSWTLYHGADIDSKARLSHGSFTFVPYWQTTSITIKGKTDLKEAQGMSCSELLISVRNRYDQESFQKFSD